MKACFAISPLFDTKYTRYTLAEERFAISTQAIAEKCI